jgi:hypothetical protein
VTQLQGVDFVIGTTPVRICSQPSSSGTSEQQRPWPFDAAGRLFQRLSPRTLDGARKIFVARMRRLANALAHELEFVPVNSATLKNTHFRFPLDLNGRSMGQKSPVDLAALFAARPIALSCVEWLLPATPPTR